MNLVEWHLTKMYMPPDEPLHSQFLGIFETCLFEALTCESEAIARAILDNHKKGLGGHGSRLFPCYGLTEV